MKTLFFILSLNICYKDQCHTEEYQLDVATKLQCINTAIFNLPQIMSNNPGTLVTWKCEEGLRL